ncbi:hypothetical protein CPC08DRAFT_300870 [Agrocybe pediades]|nr:hypothetical protein CPC08DRAFT_300870 [Agrocybe pediades]
MQSHHPAVNDFLEPRPVGGYVSMSSSESPQYHASKAGAFFCYARISPSSPKSLCHTAPPRGVKTTPLESYIRPKQARKVPFCHTLNAIRDDFGVRTQGSGPAKRLWRCLDIHCRRSLHQHWRRRQVDLWTSRNLGRCISKFSKGGEAFKSEKDFFLNLLESPAAPSTLVSPPTVRGRQGTMGLYIAEDSETDKILGLSYRHILLKTHMNTNNDYVPAPQESPTTR